MLSKVAIVGTFPLLRKLEIVDSGTPDFWERIE